LVDLLLVDPEHLQQNSSVIGNGFRVGLCMILIVTFFAVQSYFPPQFLSPYTNAVQKEPEGNVRERLLKAALILRDVLRTYGRCPI
jgi:hypothetical protein